MSIWSNVQLSNISNPMGPTINVKLKKNPLKCTNKKNLKYFMKSRSNSSKNAEKQMYEAKLVIRIYYNSLKKGCDLCLQRLSYQPTKKLVKKTELKNPTMFLKINIFNCNNRLKILIKAICWVAKFQEPN